MILILNETLSLFLSLSPLQSYFTQYLSKLSSIIRTLRQGCGLDSQTEEGEGSRGEEWTHLQIAFTLIQCCGMSHVSRSFHVRACGGTLSVIVVTSV